MSATRVCFKLLIGILHYTLNMRHLSLSRDGGNAYSGPQFGRPSVCFLSVNSYFVWCDMYSLRLIAPINDTLLCIIYQNLTSSLRVTSIDIFLMPNYENSFQNQKPGLKTSFYRIIFFQF